MLLHLQVAVGSELRRQVLWLVSRALCLHALVLVLYCHAEGCLEGIFLRLRNYILIEHLVARAMHLLAN